jgi:hypothetical protein
MKLKGDLLRTSDGRSGSRHKNCMQRYQVTMSPIGQDVRSEVMTAMTEQFTVVELNALRNDLLQSHLIDVREAGELLQVFLMGRGYGVSTQEAMAAAGRVERAGCSIPVLQEELAQLAMVM